MKTFIIQNFTLIVSVTLIATGCTQTTETRNLASQHFSHTSKSKGLLVSKIERIDGETSGSLVRLAGRVTARKNFDVVTAKWNLPEGVELVSGAASNVIKLEAQETQSFEVVVKLTNNEPQRIIFHAHEDLVNDGNKLGSIAHFIVSSQPSLTEPPAAASPAPSQKMLDPKQKSSEEKLPPIQQ